MRRGAWLFGMVVVVFALHCGSDDEKVHYAPEGDAALASATLGTWASADGAVMLRICEDRSADAQVCKRTVADSSAGDESCHVARGDGSSASQDLAAGGGCDTPGPYASMSVTVDVAISQRALASWHGEIDVGPSGSDGYGGTRTLDAASDLKQLTGAVAGAMGSLAGTYSANGLSVNLSVTRSFARADAGVADASVEAGAKAGVDAGGDAGADAGGDADADAGASEDAGASASGDAGAAADAGVDPTSLGRIELRRVQGPESCR